MEGGIDIREVKGVATVTHVLANMTWNIHTRGGRGGALVLMVGTMHVL